jgi:hypothetical protein
MRCEYEVRLARGQGQWTGYPVDRGSGRGGQMICTSAHCLRDCRPPSGRMGARGAAARSVQPPHFCLLSDAQGSHRTPVSHCSHPPSFRLLSDAQGDHVSHRTPVLHYSHRSHPTLQLHSAHLFTPRCSQASLGVFTASWQLSDALALPLAFVAYTPFLLWVGGSYASAFPAMGRRQLCQRLSCYG